MDYSNKIRQLERLWQDADNKISIMSGNVSVDDAEMVELKRLRQQYRDELSKLRRAQWEQSQRVDFDSDR